MSIAIETITYIITFVFTFCWAMGVLLPIFYSLPKTLYRVFIKKTLKARAILMILIPPLLWIVIPLITIFFMLFFVPMFVSLPKLTNYLINESPAFHVAQPLAFALFVLNFFIKEGRRNMSNNFEEFVKPYTK